MIKFMNKHYELGSVIFLFLVYCKYLYFYKHKEWNICCIDTVSVILAMVEATRMV
jgi:general stress protein CsbA